VRVYLHAWHGATVGDSVLVELTANWLRKNYDADVTFGHPELKPETIKKYDALILGPCGVIYDRGHATPRDSYRDYTDFMTSYLHAAAEAGVPMIAFNVGVQQLLRRVKSRQWARALNHVDKIITREPWSRRVLEYIGVDRPIEVCEDLGYCVPGFKPAAVKQPGIPARVPRLGINIRIEVAKFIKNWRPAISRLRNIAQIKFIMFSPDEQKIAKWLELPYDPWPNYRLSNVGIVYSELNYIVTSHLHSHIFAAMAGVPFLQYHRQWQPPEALREPIPAVKNRLSINDLEWRHTWGPKDTADILVNKVKDLFAHGEELRGRLARIREEKAAAAARNFELLGEWIKSQNIS
jgi:polysaccharide pyruvyl transferase WcaK-like protein